MRLYHPLLLACLVALWCIPSAVSTRASTPFVINSTADLRDRAPGDGACASANGSCTLRAAIQESDALGGPQIITLPAGTYLLTQAGAFEDAAAQGDLDITADLTIDGAGAQRATIDANGLDHALQIFPQATVTITGVTIRHGNSPVFEGGGITNQGALTIAQSTITANTAELDGGGIASAGPLTLDRVVVSGNTAQKGSGGGIFFHDGYNYNRAIPLSIADSTVSGNTAGNAGGGLISNGLAWLFSSTVSANRAWKEGGVGSYAFGASSMTVQNSLLAGNTSQGNYAPDCQGTLASQGYNLIQSGAGCTLLGGPGDLVGVAAGLGTFGMNGGATSTQALMASSRAIDAGNPGGCRDAAGALLETDQRGGARVFDGNGDGSARCDIGAFEFGALASPTTPTASPSPRPTRTPSPTATATPAVTATPTATATPAAPECLVYGAADRGQATSQLFALDPATGEGALAWSGVALLSIDPAAPPLPDPHDAPVVRGTPKLYLPIAGASAAR